MAAWVTRMAEKHEGWAAAVITRALEELRSAVRTGQPLVAQLFLRFVVCLGNTGLLGLNGVMTLLNEVLNLSSGLRSNKGGDFGVYLTLASLPFVSPASFKLVAESVNAIVARADTYMAARDPKWKQVLRLIPAEDVADRLAALFNGVKAMQKAEWSSEAVLIVPGFEPCVHGRVPAMDAKLGPLDVTAEDVRKIKLRFMVPLVATRLLTGGEDGADDDMALHDRWILEDYMLTTIETFNQDVEECATQILRIPIMHPQFEAIVVETVFSQMLRLPNPPMVPLFYGRLLLALGEKQASLRRLVRRTFRVLCERAPELDEDCLQVLAEAFAYHLMLNNYEADWAPFNADAVPVLTQRLARRSLERLQRLSWHENLLHRLPESIHVYIPPEPVPMTDLPIQAKPEYDRMMTLVRIKDADEKNVRRYCDRLLKLETTKEEPDKGDEKPEADVSGVALPVEPGPEPPTGDTACILATKTKEEATTEEDNRGRRAQEEEDVAEYGVDEPEEEAQPVSSSKRRRTDKHGSSTSGIATEAVPFSDVKDASHVDENRKRQFDTVSNVKEELKREDGLDGANEKAASTSVGSAKRESKSGSGEEEEEGIIDPLGEPPVQPWRLEDVAELLTAAVMQNGSKTNTHMNKIFDLHEKIFMNLRPTEEGELHDYIKAIVRCVFAFWRMSGQRLEITLDSMIHRGVVTGKAVAELALEQFAQVGDSMAGWNMVNSVARKSLEKSQSVRVELAAAKRLENTEVVERCKKQLHAAVEETAQLFTVIFVGLVRNFQDLEDKDQTLRHVTLQRVLVVGRKYHAFIKPLIVAAESRIPGVAHNPEIAAVFDMLREL
eukprot:TRINITY_DN60704_c0_g1_i1.p1 TRINITY_DN60704_c0_g1~~TRINITY_DN60704_c0_g1_i1.p1  ORF type:complete len:963 (-),score=220.44 TRINITY_DN60704_c0_g1_i1:62-2572(-)